MRTHLQAKHCNPLPHTYLNLLHSEVQKGPITTNGNETLGSDTPHGGPKPTIEFQHHQLVQQFPGPTIRGRLEGRVWNDRLIEEGLDLIPDDGVPSLTILEKLLKHPPKVIQVGPKLLYVGTLIT